MRVLGSYEEYEEEYRQWSKSDSKVTYCDSVAAKTTYIDGRGFDSSKKHASAEKTLSRCAAVIGCSLLAVMLFETLGKAMLSWMLSRIGLGADYAIYIGGFTMQKFYASLVSVAFELVKYAVPLVLLKLYCGIPNSIVFNNRTREKHCKYFYLMIIGLVFGLSTTASLVFSHLGFQVGFFSDAAKYFRYSDVSLLFFNAFFEIFAKPFLHTIFLYGIVLRILLQFGERFAVVTTAVISALIIHDCVETVPVLIMAYFSALCAVRCGTVLPIFFGRALYRLLSFFVYFLGYTFQNTYGRMAVVSILVISVATGAAALVYAIINHNTQIMKVPPKKPSGNEDSLYLTMCFSPAFAAGMIFALVLLIYDIVQLYI